MIEYVNLVCMQALDIVPLFSIDNKHFYATDTSKDSSFQSLWPSWKNNN